MNKNMIIDRLNQKQNGSFFKIEYVSDIKLTAAAKKAGHTAYKQTVMTVRKGIRYANQKSVKNKIALKVQNGEISAYDAQHMKHELSWGSWVPQHEGLLIEHKGQTYVRFYASPNKATSRFFLDGVEVTLDGLRNSGLVQNSWFNSSGEKPDALTIKAENISKIF